MKRSTADSFAAAAPYRLRDRTLEALVPGAELLLDAFALVDLSAAEAAEAARCAGRPPVCVTGCAECCRQPIPLTPLEALVLRVQLHTRLPEGLRKDFFAGVTQHPAEAVRRACPFLQNNICICYALRPLACRRYAVCGRPCAPGEDAAASRPAELVRPCPDALRTALLHTLPWYQARPDYPAAHIGDKEAFLRSVTMLIQELPWDLPAEVLRKQPLGRGKRCL